MTRLVLAFLLASTAAQAQTSYSQPYGAARARPVIVDAPKPWPPANLTPADIDRISTENMGRCGPYGCPEKK